MHDLEKSIGRALETLNRGAESIRFTIEDETINVERLLEKLPLEKTSVYFHLSFLSIDFVKRIDTIAKNRNAEMTAKSEHHPRMLKRVAQCFLYILFLKFLIHKYTF